MSRRNDAVFSAPAILDAMRSSIRILAFGMLGLILLYLGSGITVIGPNEVGLVLRFGKLLSQPHPPGLLFALPPPIDEVVRVPVKSLQEVSLDLWAAPRDDNPQGSLSPVKQPYTLTGDVNIIQARFVVRYQISDPAEYLLAAKDREALRDAILYQSVCQVRS